MKMDAILRAAELAEGRGKATDALADLPETPEPGERAADPDADPLVLAQTNRVSEVDGQTELPLVATQDARDDATAEAAGYVGTSDTFDFIF